MQFNVLYESKNFFVSSVHHSFESETFRVLFFTKKGPNIRGEVKNWTSENRRETFGYLEIFGRPQAVENSRRYLLLRKDNLFYRKQSLGAPDEGISE